MEINQNEQQLAVNAIYEYAANLLINENKSTGEVTDALMKQGLEYDIASQIVENLENQIAEAKKERARKDVLYGALWCVGGIAVTAVTYSAASSGGGHYFVAWGAILFGGIQFIKGLANS